MPQRNAEKTQKAPDQTEKQQKVTAQKEQPEQEQEPDAPKKSILERFFGRIEYLPEKLLNLVSRLLQTAFRLLELPFRLLEKLEQKIQAGRRLKRKWESVKKFFRSKMTVSVFCSAGCSADVCSFFASAFCSAVFSASGAFSVSFSSVRDTDASPRRIFFSRRFHVSSDAPKSRICASGFCSSYEAVSATAPKSHDTLPLAFTQANPSSSFRTCAR